MSLRTLSLGQARRIALAAQGLARPSRAATRIDLRQLRSTFGRLGVVQIDSVNVLTRAHHLPFFSRLGAYDRDRLDRWLWQGDETWEYHAHEAAIVPLELHPLMRHRMEWFRDHFSLDAQALRFTRAVRDEVAERGPLAATELADGGKRTGPWWGLSRGKRAVRYLHRVGELGIAHRRTNFETVYDLPDRILPAPILAAESVDADEAHRALVRLAARAHGVGTAADLADYHRLRVAPARRALDSLVAAGELERVAVQGWSDQAYLDPEAPMPRRASGQALLSPFDPLVWFRPRVERLFGFHYRIEIYVPEPKRRYGYYVLPFLLGDELVARVDLKADRAAGVLRVQGAFAEPGGDPRRVAGPLADELTSMARWLGLDATVVADRGDLAHPLRSALSAGG
ncbi:MAG: crosslink repair DNA glycosylase YcaQ family protein [Acidimicrobiales bacterium]|nr:crosslink repair DNA glycosylase YcaQ family protein [Acidimicrobiales bacterium]